MVSEKAEEFQIIFTIAPCAKIDQYASLHKYNYLVYRNGIKINTKHVYFIFFFFTVKELDYGSPKQREDVVVYCNVCAHCTSLKNHHSHNLVDISIYIERKQGDF